MCVVVSKPTVLPTVQQVRLATVSGPRPQPRHRRCCDTALCHSPKTRKALRSNGLRTVHWGPCVSPLCHTAAKTGLEIQTFQRFQGVGKNWWMRQGEGEVLRDHGPSTAPLHRFQPCVPGRPCASPEAVWRRMARLRVRAQPWCDRAPDGAPERLPDRFPTVFSTIPQAASATAL